MIMMLVQFSAGYVHSHTPLLILETGLIQYNRITTIYYRLLISELGYRLDHLINGQENAVIS